MEGVNPTSSPATLLTNDRTTQTRNPDEQNTLTPPAPPQQDPPRVNEGPSTITSISPQAQQLAQQEQNAANDSANRPPENPANNPSPPPRNDAAPPDRGDDPAASPPAEPSNTPAASSQNGRAFDDRSPNSFLRN